MDSYSEDEVRFREQALVARSFINYGYGLSCLDEETRCRSGGVVVERNRYKALSNQVASLAYRALEEFLMRDCDRKIVPLSS